jgi:hypothetical protein
MQITVDGMDFLENRKPLPEDVMPLIKPEALAVSDAQPETSPAAKRQGQSVVETLNRALARTSV